MPAQLIQWTDATVDRMIDFIKADDLTRRTVYKREDEGMSGITKSEAWLHIATAIVDAGQREEIEQNPLYGRKCAKAVGNKLRR